MNAWEEIAALHREGVDAVVITLTAVRGSVPGQVGAKAIVTAGGIVFRLLRSPLALQPSCWIFARRADHLEHCHPEWRN